MLQVKELFKTALLFKEIIFTTVVLCVLVLSTWLTINLIPINQSIDSLVIRVNAQEEVDNKFGEQMQTMSNDIIIIRGDTSYIRGVLSKN